MVWVLGESLVLPAESLNQKLEALWKQKVI